MRKFSALCTKLGLAFGFLASLPVCFPASSDAQQPQTSKLLSVKVSGSRKFTEAQIAAASGLKVGDRVSREDFQAAADRLASLGPFTGVRYRFTSLVEGVTLSLELADAPSVPVAFDNFPWFTDEELTQALKGSVVLFDGAAPEQGSILDAMAQALEQLLAGRGVRGRVERNLTGRVGSDALVQQFRVVGASLKVGAVQFGDKLATEDRRISDLVRELVGKPFSRYTAELFLFEQVRPVYLERGHLRVSFGTPQARFTGDPNKPLPDNVIVILPIAPGPVFRWAGAAWRGNTVYDTAALDQVLGFAENELANGMKITGGWERVAVEYARRGHLDAKVEPEPAYDDAAGRVSYRVAITEGPQYRMGELVLTGLSLTAERKVSAAWRIARGEVFDRGYFNDFLNQGIKQLFDDEIVRYKEIGHLLRTNPETRTVDVLLDFR